MKYGKKKMKGGGRLYDYMDKGGKLKMVENEKGEKVPFYAADGEGKMEMGGKMRGYKMMQEGGETDPPKRQTAAEAYADAVENSDDGGQAYRIKARKSILNQIDEMQREKSETKGVVSETSLYAKANPDMKGSMNLSEKYRKDVDQFYEDKMQKLKKTMEMFAEPVEVEGKEYDREEFLKMIGGTDESIDMGGLD